MTKCMIMTGRVFPGYQFASGLAVGRDTNPSPFAAGTIKMQAEPFKARGFDFEAEVPGLVWATINVRLPLEVEVDRPDWALELVDWTTGTGGKEIPPETFFITRCCLAHNRRYYPGVIYTPSPDTKPDTNGHDYSVIEIIAGRVANHAYGDEVSVMCKLDAFNPHGT